MRPQEKQIDDRGRLMLGKEFSSKRYQVEVMDNGQIILKPVVSVPIHEEWLWKNKEALEMVTEGLKQAQAGKFAKTPNIKADLALFDDEK